MSEKSPTIAAVAIAKNEELDIRGFLDNLLPWVDEVVVVDDGSTDATRDILRAAGDKVKVIERDMDAETGFSGQRNAGIEAAESDWLLHMDIDERVTPELAKELRQAADDERYNGYRYHRLNFFLHRPMPAGGWQYWNRPQFARRGKHLFKNKIHEACVIEGDPDTIGQLQSDMWHFVDADYVERVTKNLNYMQMSGQHIIDKGITVRWYHLLIHPAYQAFKSYFIQGGFTQGTRGLLFGIYMFSSTFNWWAYAWDRQNRIPREDLEQQLKDKWLEQTDDD